jgi:hypothetical protein
MALRFKLSLMVDRQVLYHSSKAILNMLKNN